MAMSERDTEARSEAREGFEQWQRERKDEARKRVSLCERIEAYLADISKYDDPDDPDDTMTGAIVRDIRRILAGEA